jgi:hypothetical protein
MAQVGVVLLVSFTSLRGNSLYAGRCLILICLNVKRQI